MVVIGVNAYWLWRLVWCVCWFVEIVMETGMGECVGIDCNVMERKGGGWFEDGELECV